MVLTRRDDRYEALAATGRVTFERTEHGAFVEVATSGRNPLADQATDKFVGLENEREHLHPHRDANAYPFAYEQTAQLFDSPAAPDLCVIHSAAHNWADQGGHLGEHGSIGIVQARAPMVIGGKGVKSLGLIPKAARLVDAAPTIAALLGCAPRPDGNYVARPGRRTAPRRARPVGTPEPCCRVPLRRHQLQRALRHVRPRRSTECRPPHRDGGRVRSRRDVFAAHRDAREPHVDHHGRASRTPRNPEQRVVRPRNRRAGHHELAGNLAVEHAASRARHRVDPRRRAPNVARRVHRIGERAVRQRCELLDLRLLPPGRRAADPEGSTRPPAHHRAVRSPVEGLLVVVGRRPHGSRPGARHHRRQLPRRELSDASVHVVQLHAHRLRDARRWAAFGDGGRVDT